MDAYTGNGTGHGGTNSTAYGGAAGAYGHSGGGHAIGPVPPGEEVGGLK